MQLEIAMMKQITATGPVCIALVLLVLLFSSRAGSEEPKKVDLSATFRYVEEWGAREGFPDSPSFAFMNIYCRLALGGQVSDAMRKQVIDYLAKCQKADGGFASAPETGEASAAGSNIISTWFALAALDLIDGLSTVDTKRAADFILSQVQKDGGIKPAADSKAANIGITWYGIRSLHLLKALDRIDRNRVIEYLKSHRDDDKGFGVLPGKPSAPQSTSMAVDCLKMLGVLTDDIKPGISRYLDETPYSGLTDPQNQALMTLDNEAYVLQAASDLAHLQQFNTERVKKFVYSLYIPENGGFGPSIGLGSTPPSTFYAIECLVRLGELKDPYAGRN